MGIFLILLALFFAAGYIRAREKSNHLLFSGLFLGLAVATKYTFIPAVVGFTVGVFVISTDWHLRSFRSYFSGLLKRDIWLLVAGMIVGFLLVTGFFIIKHRNSSFPKLFLARLNIVLAILSIISSPNSRHCHQVCARYFI